MFKVIQKAGLLIHVAQYIGDINGFYLVKERVVQHTFDAGGWQSPLCFAGAIAQDDVLVVTVIDAPTDLL